VRRQPFGPLPRFGESFAVEEPENAAHEKQHGLVERSRNGEEPKRAAPSKWPWDAAVPDHDLDGSDCSSDEGACGPHASSLRRTGPFFCALGAQAAALPMLAIPRARSGCLS
jgi:hypothetical protein